MLKELEAFASKEEDRWAICQDLLQAGCCSRCTMRFLGEKRHSVYTFSQQELLSKYFTPADNQAAAVDPVPSSASQQQCPACLGILQCLACSEFYQQMVDQVNATDHEFHDYQFSLTLPVATILRQHAVFVFLLEKYELIYQGKKDQIASVKDVYKWSAGPDFSKLLGVPFQNRSSFDVHLHVTYQPSDKECSFLLDTFPDTFRRRKNKKGENDTFSRASVQKVLENMVPSSFASKFSCPPSLPSQACTCEISVFYDSVFVAGRYQKYSRELSQTPWVVDGKTKGAGCVQDGICQVILTRFRPTDHKFSASGREDVDVQMLGTGRPFVVELINCHRIDFTPEDMIAIQKETNALRKDIAVRDLQIVTREEVGRLKEGEQDKSKAYTALCWCERPLIPQEVTAINSTKDLVVQQKTPIRVLHRRTLATRERTIYSLQVEQAAGLYFKLHLSTQAGTYVKEFVHGDFGRTQPNLSTILNAECDILYLDVTAVNVDWPPTIDPLPEEGDSGEKNDSVVIDNCAVSEPMEQSVNSQ